MDARETIKYTLLDVEAFGCETNKYELLNADETSMDEEATIQTAMC